MTVRADSARPELISYLNKEGLNVISAHKGPGSVEDGIRYLLAFREIVVHPRYRHSAEEMRLYCYKRDPYTGDILPVLKPGHDHCIDALRYAVEEIWNTKTARIAEWSASDLGL